MKLQAAVATTMWLVAGIGLADGVTVHSDPKADFSSFETYAWKGGKHLATGKHETVESVIDQLVRRGVNEQLTAQGARIVDNQPDAWIAYHVGAEEEEGVSGYPIPGDPYFEYNFDTAAVSAFQANMTQDFTEGTVVIDIVDAGTNYVVWSAFCKAGFSTQQKGLKKLENLIKKAFKQYPPEN